MLQPEVLVCKGLKIGDIKCRCCPECADDFSDKARSVGSDVLEAGCISLHSPPQVWDQRFLAAGESRRFGGDKLSEVYQGMPLYRHTTKVGENIIFREWW